MTRRFARIKTIPWLLSIASILSSVGHDESLPESIEVLEYERVPIEIQIGTGVTTRLFFGEGVAFGLSPQLSSSLATVNLDNVVHLIPQEPFPPTLVPIHLKQSKRLVVLKLSATSVAQDERDYLVRVKAHIEPKKQAELLTPLELLQLFVSEERPIQLSHTSEEVVRGELATPYPTFTTQKHMVVQPKEVWRSVRYEIYVVEIKNNYKEAIEVDSKFIDSNWLATSFEKRELVAKRKEGSTTRALFVRSRTDLEES